MKIWIFFLNKEKKRKEKVHASLNEEYMWLRNEGFTIIPQGKVWGYPDHTLNRILGKGPFFLQAQNFLTNSL